MCQDAGADVHRVLAAACEPVPARDPVVYLADFACQVLVPLAAGAVEQEVAGTMAGRAFTTGRPVTSDQDGLVRVWVPVVEQTTRTGVLAVTVPHAGPQILAQPVGGGPDRVLAYAPGAEALLAELQPELGVSEISQAGALEALRGCSELIMRRTQIVRAERPLLTQALRERDFEVTDSQANFLWAAHPSLEGGELAARLARAGVLVAAGAALGEPHHVRIAIRDRAASSRLLSAVDKTL